jgi:hypothetical protein
MPAQAHVAAFADVHLPAGLVIAGSLVMAAATVLGAWLALRRPGRSDVQLGAAAGALLMIAGLHLLPDAWSAARADRLWPLAPPRSPPTPCRRQPGRYFSPWRRACWPRPPPGSPRLLALLIEFRMYRTGSGLRHLALCIRAGEAC